jgi:hypothetical protein
MRENAVKKSLAAGRRAFGSMIFEFFTPGMPRIVKNAGAEFALYCMEHTGTGFETFIVSCTRYPPARRRGAAFGFAHNGYEDETQGLTSPGKCLPARRPTR